MSTAVEMGTLETVVDALTRAPEDCTLHPKIAKVLESRSKLWASGQVDWALGEALAYGTIVLDGRDVRLCGQDTRRGTFGHRNAVYVDYRTGAEHIPLADMARQQPRRALAGSLSTTPSCRNMPLSVSSTVTRCFLPDALVAWEAQFGDFVNGAQIIIDQFLAASECQVGPDIRAWYCCSPTATRGRAPSIRQPGWSVSWNCARRTTCVWRM